MSSSTFHLSYSCVHFFTLLSSIPRYVTTNSRQVVTYASSESEQSTLMITCTFAAAFRSLTRVPSPCATNYLTQKLSTLILYVSL